MAGRLGYCGMDREHLALTGEEVRACWQAPQAAEPWEGLFSELPRPQPPDTERVGDGAVLSVRPSDGDRGHGRCVPGRHGVCEPPPRAPTMLRGPAPSRSNRGASRWPSR